MFKNWKSENKEVLNHVVCRALELSISKKQIENHSDDYCGIFVDARPRALGLVEEYAAFRSFKALSKANYPLFAFINENYTKDFLNEKLIKDWRINVIPIRNLDCSQNLAEYSDFMIKELPGLIPENYPKGLFFQSDGFLLNLGWEDQVEYANTPFLGAPTRHISSIIFPDNPDLSNFGIISMNGGFSYRYLPYMRRLSEKYGKLKCYERGRADFAAPPEDLWFSYLSMLDYKMPKYEDAALFSQDPLKSIDDIKNTYGFHSCQY